MSYSSAHVLYTQPTLCCYDLATKNIICINIPRTGSNGGGLYISRKVRKERGRRRREIICAVA